MSEHVDTHAVRTEEADEFSEVAVTRHKDEMTAVGSNKSRGSKSDMAISVLSGAYGQEALRTPEVCAKRRVAIVLERDAGGNASFAHRGSETANVKHSAGFRLAPVLLIVDVHKYGDGHGFSFDAIELS